jgi:hypothetical protein
MPTDGTTPGPYGAGTYWRDKLSETVERAGSRSSVADLLHAVSGCNVGLVDVAGWLTDEIAVGHVRASEGDGVSVLPRRYEMAPGARSYRARMSR